MDTYIVVGWLVGWLCGWLVVWLYLYLREHLIIHHNHRIGMTCEMWCNQSVIHAIVPHVTVPLKVICGDVHRTLGFVSS